MPIAGCHKRLCAAGSSGALLPPSPPAEKGAARQDQAGKASAQRGLSFGEEAPQKAGSSSAQYVVDHIFVYRCDQNLPHKINDV